MSSLLWPNTMAPTTMMLASMCYSGTFPSSMLRISRDRWNSAAVPPYRATSSPCKCRLSQRRRMRQLVRWMLYRLTLIRLSSIQVKRFYSLRSTKSFKLYAHTHKYIYTEERNTHTHTRYKKRNTLSAVVVYIVSIHTLIFLSDLSHYVRL